MTFSSAVKLKLGSDKISIPKQGGFFEAQHQLNDGEEFVWVDCLRDYPFLKYEVFDQVEKAFSAYGNVLERGDVMGPRLGEKKLPLDSVEGQIAVVYDYKLGDSVFRRASPVCNILVWAGLCTHIPGALKKN